MTGHVINRIKMFPVLCAKPTSTSISSFPSTHPVRITLRGIRLVNRTTELPNRPKPPQADRPPQNNNGMEGGINGLFGGANVVYYY